MKRSLVILMILTLGAGTLLAQEPEGQKTSAAGTVRFSFVDVSIDSHENLLAAYQLELAAEVGEVRIVGIEGGEHAAFEQPPYYDPAAISRDRVILAAFSTAKQLPKGSTRVARIHVQITGDVVPRYAVKLNVAASTDGKKIRAEVTLSPQGETK